VIARGGRRRGECLVDLVADFFADGCRGIEVGVVAAGVECGGEIKEGFRGLKGDGGSAGLGLCHAGARGERLLLVLEGWVGLRAGA
jgi:hypothetical protein